MTIVAQSAVVVFIAAAIQSAWQLRVVVPGREASFLSTQEADGVHLVMNAVMAFMLTPAYNGRAAGVLTGIFAAMIGVLVASLAIRRGAARGLSRQARAVGVAYHVLMLAAMIYAVALMTPTTSMAPGGMSGMSMAPRPWLTLPRVLGVVFAIDALIGSVAVVFFPRALIQSERGGWDGDQMTVGPALVRQLRLGLLPHLVMDAGMTWMLIMA